MLERAMILDKLPSAEDFYATYWGKRPFIIRNFISPALIDSLIDADTLAGLSLEEDIKSRIILNNNAGNEWTCAYGPFEEERFATLGEHNWSLLVHNVEQHHNETAQLLVPFHFSPRWLLDDIMVSYSAPGGSVGPHIDSYHTFLIQGMGKRTWKISNEPVEDTRLVDNPDVKVLAHGFEGESFEVTAGDVIYMPPFFGHEGKTIEAAMTFSVGFLGPKTSELLSEYAHYLEENEHLNKRYLGSDLTRDSSGFCIGKATGQTIRDDLITTLASDDFTRWMAVYFSAPTHISEEEPDTHGVPLSSQAMAKRLNNGEILYRPEHVKMVITQVTDGAFHLAVYEQCLSLPGNQMGLIEKLNTAHDITQDDIKSGCNNDACIEALTMLYNYNALRFKD